MTDPLLDYDYDYDYDYEHEHECEFVVCASSFPGSAGTFAGLLVRN